MTPNTAESALAETVALAARQFVELQIYTQPEAAALLHAADYSGRAAKRTHWAAGIAVAVPEVGRGSKIISRSRPRDRAAPLAIPLTEGFPPN